MSDNSVAADPWGLPVDPTPQGQPAPEKPDTDPEPDADAEATPDEDQEDLATAAPDAPTDHTAESAWARPLREEAPPPEIPGAPSATPAPPEADHPATPDEPGSEEPFEMALPSTPAPFVEISSSAGGEPETDETEQPADTEHGTGAESQDIAEALTKLQSGSDGTGDAYTGAAEEPDTDETVESRHEDDEAIADELTNVSDELDARRAHVGPADSGLDEPEEQEDTSPDSVLAAITQLGGDDTEQVEVVEAGDDGPDDPTDDGTEPDGTTMLDFAVSLEQKSGAWQDLDGGYEPEGSNDSQPSQTAWSPEFHAGSLFGQEPQPASEALDAGAEDSAMEIDGDADVEAALSSLSDAMEADGGELAMEPEGTQGVASAPAAPEGDTGHAESDAPATAFVDDIPDDLPDWAVDHTAAPVVADPGSVTAEPAARVEPVDDTADLTTEPDQPDADVEIGEPADVTAEHPTEPDEPAEVTVEDAGDASTALWTDVTADQQPSGLDAPLSSQPTPSVYKELEELPPTPAMRERRIEHGDDEQASAPVPASTEAEFAAIVDHPDAASAAPVSEPESQEDEPPGRDAAFARDEISSETGPAVEELPPAEPEETAVAMPDEASETDEAPASEEDARVDAAHAPGDHAVADPFAASPAGPVPTEDADAEPDAPEGADEKPNLGALVAAAATAPAGLALGDAEADDPSLATEVVPDDGPAEASQETAADAPETPAVEQPADSVIAGGPAGAPATAAWASRWAESAQGWVDGQGDGVASEWRPIVATVSTIHGWAAETYLGLVAGDAPLSDHPDIGTARSAAVLAMVEESLARGAHAVIGVNVAIHEVAGNTLVTATGTAVTLSPTA